MPSFETTLSREDGELAVEVEFSAERSAETGWQLEVAIGAVLFKGAEILTTTDEDEELRAEAYSRMAA